LVIYPNNIKKEIGISLLCLKNAVNETLEVAVSKNCFGIAPSKLFLEWNSGLKRFAEM